MKRLLLGMLVAAFTTVSLSADTKEITFGFAQTDVTPPIGCKLACWKRKTNAVAVHDKLYAQCIAVEDSNGRTMLFVGGDLMYFQKGQVDYIRQYCHNKYKINPSDIIFSGSHTHNGPKHSSKYDHQVRPALKKIVDEAIKNCTIKGSLKIGRTENDLGVSRRLPYEYNGRKGICFRPYAKGIIDRTLTVLAFYDTSKKLRNFVWIYGCHNTGYGAYVDKKVQISADWTGAVRDLFNEKMPHVGSLFMQGSAGDVKPRFIGQGLDKRGRTRWQVPTSEDMKNFGIKYGSQIVEFIKTIKQQPDVPVDIKSALGSFNLTYDTQGKILKGKVKTQTQLKDLIAAKTTSGKDRKKYENLLKGGWYVGGKPQSTWQCQKVQLNDKVQILGLSGESTGGVARLLYNTYKDKMNIFVGYIHRGSYITDRAQQQEGGYEAKGYDSTIDESIINGFKKLKVK